MQETAVLLATHSVVRFLGRYTLGPYAVSVPTTPHRGHKRTLSQYRPPPTKSQKQLCTLGIRLVSFGIGFGRARRYLVAGVRNCRGKIKVVVQQALQLIVHPDLDVLCGTAVQRISTGQRRRRTAPQYRTWTTPYGASVPGQHCQKQRYRVRGALAQHISTGPTVPLRVGQYQTRVGPYPLSVPVRLGRGSDLPETVSVRMTLTTNFTRCTPS
eukprot:2977134-Rhodomonas_salina.1